MHHSYSFMSKRRVRVPLRLDPATGEWHPIPELVELLPGEVLEPDTDRPDLRVERIYRQPGNVAALYLTMNGDAVRRS